MEEAPGIGDRTADLDSRSFFQSVAVAAQVRREETSVPQDPFRSFVLFMLFLSRLLENVMTAGSALDAIRAHGILATVPTTERRSVHQRTIDNPEPRL
jgi:hypothetical protein